MRQIGGLVGGTLLGLIGTAIWLALGYYSIREVGWMACVAGAMVGYGVLTGGRAHGRVRRGLVAAALAAVVVAAGQSAALVFVQPRITRDEMAVARIAEFVITEHEQAGFKVEMPVRHDATRVRDLFPDHIWQEARRHWHTLAPDERDKVRRNVRVTETALGAEWRASMGRPSNIFWLVLAVAGACSIAASLRPQSDAERLAMEEGPLPLAGSGFWPPHLRQPVGAAAENVRPPVPGAPGRAAPAVPAGPAIRGSRSTNEPLDAADRNALAGLRIPPPPRPVKGTGPSAKEAPAGR